MLTDDERRKLGELYEAKRGEVLHICQRILRDADEAADACQEVFIVAGRQLFSDTPPRQADAWLRAVARNHCLELLRRRGRFARLVPRIGAATPETEDPEGAVVGRHHLAALMATLSARERMALWRSAVEHMPVAEIARELKLTYMATAQVISRARRHAAVAMARAAAAVAGIPLLRRGLSGVAATRLPEAPPHLAALIAVPLILASVQSSSSPDGVGGEHSGVTPATVYQVVSPDSPAQQALAASVKPGPSAILDHPAQSGPPGTAGVPAPPVREVEGAVTAVRGIVHQLMPSPSTPLVTPGAVSSGSPLPTPRVSE